MCSHETSHSKVPQDERVGLTGSLTRQTSFRHLPRNAVPSFEIDANNDCPAKETKSSDMKSSAYEKANLLLNTGRHSNNEKNGSSRTPIVVNLSEFVFPIRFACTNMIAQNNSQNFSRSKKKLKINKKDKKRSAY